MSGGKVNLEYPFNNKFEPKGDEAARVLAFLNGKSLSPLTDEGVSEYARFKQEKESANVTEELFGYMVTLVGAETIFRLDDDTIESIRDTFTEWKERQSRFYLRLVPPALESILTRMSAGDQFSLLDELLRETASVVDDSDEAEEVLLSHSQPMPMSMEDSESVISSVVGAELEGHKAHRLMFQTGKNRIQPKTFEIPGREDAEVTQKMFDFMDLGSAFQGKELREVKDVLEPHASRFRNAQKVMAAATNVNEALTQLTFQYVLGRLLKDVCDGYQWIDVRDMISAEHQIEVCGEYMDAQYHKKHGSAPGEMSTPSNVLLKLQSDLVVTSANVRGKTKQEQLGAFLGCSVNIGMKPYRSLRGDETKAKTQVCVESMMRACHGKGKGTVLCSLLCDSAGLCVLVHEIHELRADDIYYISRWESDPTRMMAIIVWLVNLSKQANVRFGEVLRQNGIEVCGWEQFHENSRRKKRKKNSEDDAKSSMERILEDYANDEKEEDLEEDLEVIDAADLFEDRADEEAPGRALSDALHQLLFATNNALSKKDLRVLDDKSGNGSLEFCFATGHWRSQAGIDIEA